MKKALLRTWLVLTALMAVAAYPLYRVVVDIAQRPCGLELCFLLRDGSMDCKQNTVSVADDVSFSVPRELHLSGTGHVAFRCGVNWARDESFHEEAE